MPLYTLDLQPYDPNTDNGIFDTTNAIDIENPPPVTFKQLSKMLLMIEYLIDFFEQLSPSEIEQAKYCNEVLCNFINSRSLNDPERIQLIDRLRSLQASLFGKPGPAAVFYRIFPSVHQLNSAQDTRRKSKDEKKRGPQGW